MTAVKYQQSQDSRQPKAQAQLLNVLLKIIARPEYKQLIADRLSTAVRIPTEVGDGMGHVGQDKAWEIFYEFTKYLKETFPIVFERLEHETINEHAHLLTWQGEDPSLKPLLLMAHTDVVPATLDTTGAWTYEPFSGHYDGKFVWGRGSEDDKSNVVVILSIIELLLQHSFTPARTIIVALGFDEEGGAEKSYGARCLAERVLTRYGANGIELIFDEGMAGVETRYGAEVALPATAEKGYLDVTMRIDTPGGHTQEPPKHTGIGFLAQAIQIIEDAELPPELQSNHPILSFFFQAFLKGLDIPESLKSALKGSNPLEDVRDFMCRHSDLLTLIQTTRAVSVVGGGDKANSLPESAFALVNHRIAPHDSVQIVKDHYVSLLAPWAKENKIALVAFGEQLSQFEEPTGTLTLTSAYDLDPSPIANIEDSRYDLLAGTLRFVFGDHVLVSPTILQGNTDTRYYWDLTDQIYRMSPWRAGHDPRGTRMHTVDERMPIAGLMEGCKFYATFILNVDELRR